MSKSLFSCQVQPSLISIRMNVVQDDRRGLQDRNTAMEQQVHDSRKDLSLLQSKFV